jgi:hypothetical protein
VSWRGQKVLILPVTPDPAARADVRSQCSGGVSKLARPRMGSSLEWLQFAIISYCGPPTCATGCPFRRSLYESAADARDSRRGERDSLVSRHQLVYLDPVMYRGFFADRSTNSSPMTMSSPLDGAAGLIGSSGRSTANACDTNASTTHADTTAHLIFVAKTTFTEIRAPSPS